MANINVTHKLARGRTKYLITSFTSLKTEIYCLQTEIPSPVSWSTRVILIPKLTEKHTEISKAQSVFCAASYSKEYA
jgi:hypothetical protein